MRWIVYISLTLCIACTRHEVAEPKVNSIASLHAIDAFNRSVLITENIFVEGLVVANDAFGEFPYKLIIQDSSGGVEILCSSERLYTSYPLGARVRVSCNGLYLSSYNGVVRLGAEPTSDYSMGYMTPLETSVHVRVEALESLPAPTMLDVDDISVEHISTLVGLDAVAIESDYETFCAFDELTGKPLHTMHRVVDNNGCSVPLRVNKNALYATEPLPTGKGLIYCIVDYEDDDFALIITASSLFF